MKIIKEILSRLFNVIGFLIIIPAMIWNGIFYKDKS